MNGKKFSEIKNMAQNDELAKKYIKTFWSYMITVEFIDINKYKESFDYMYNLITSNIGEDGTVKYRSFMDKYRYVDTIGFICPFLIAYGYKYKKRECIDLAIKQITSYNEYGFYDKVFLPYHAYKINDKSHLGLNGWGRG